MIHWAWVVPIAILSGSAGYMCCALMVMAKQSDTAMDGMRDREELRQIIEHKDRTIVRLENQLNGA